MKHVSQIANLNQIQKNSGITPKSELPPQPEKITSRLFARMALMYGHKFMSLYGDIDVKVEAEREWGRNLSDFTLDDIKRGLDKCVDEYPSWPPTIGEFRQLCKINESDLGLPSAESAWAEISIDSGYHEIGELPKQCTHGIILAARSDTRCDVYNWKLLPIDKGLKLFKPIYREYVKAVIAGEVFELPVMLENKKDRPVTFEECKEHASGHLDAMKDALK